MKASARQLLFAAALLAGTLALSACNRGYGCPTNFSLTAEQPAQLK